MSEGSVVECAVKTRGAGNRRARAVPVLAGCALALVLTTGVARGGTAHPSTLVFDRAISSIRLGESRARVFADWGKGKRDGGTWMYETSYSFTTGGVIRRYAVPGGYLRVGFHKQRVVYIAVNTSSYKTTSGVGLGYRIQQAEHVTLDGDAFRYAASCGCWETSTRFVPYPKDARFEPKPNKAYKRWVAERRRTRGTSLTVNKQGVVILVEIFRGDVCLVC